MWLLLLLVVVVWLLQQLLLVVVIVLLLLVLLSLSLQLLFNLLLLRGAIVLVVLLPAPAAGHLPSLRGARAADALTGRAQQMPRVAPPSVACAQCRTQFMECGNHLRINELAKDPGAATGHTGGTPLRTSQCMQNHGSQSVEQRTRSRTCDMDWP